MKLKYILNLICCCCLVMLSTTALLGQGATCEEATPICGGASAPAVTGGGNTNTSDNSNCLFSTLNETWFTVEITAAGSISYPISIAPASDIDFAAWGPFTDPVAGCSAISTANEVSCDFSTANGGTLTIPNGMVGEFYLILISNFGDDAGTLTAAPNTGTGAEQCPCSFLSAALDIGACNDNGTPADPADDFYTVTFDVDFMDASSPDVTLDGALMTTTNTATTTNGVVSYTIDLPADGTTTQAGQIVIGDGSGTCTIDFGAFTAPAVCSFPCEIVIETIGGAGFNECQNIQDDFDADGSFPGFPGFTAAQDPCEFCAATAVSIDFGVQPTGCDPATNSTSTEYWSFILSGTPNPLDPCAGIADGSIPNDDDNEIDLGDYWDHPEADGCSPVYFSTQFDIQVTDPGCPCDGSCITSDPITVQVFPPGFAGFSTLVTPGNCDGPGMVEIFPVDGTGAILLDPTGAEVGACQVIVDGTFSAPVCGDTGTDMINITIVDSELQALSPVTDVCIDIADIAVPFECLCCDQVYDFVADDICGGESPTFAIQPGCDPGTLDPFGLELDLDFYIYSPGGVPGEAPATFDPTGGLAVSNNFPITPDVPELTNVGGVGGTWNGTICADLLGPALTNNSCAPTVVSFFVLPWSRIFDTDGDGTFGEYQFADDSACEPLRIDVTIYPAALTVNVVDDGTTCGTPAIELQAADGTVCEMLTGPACSSNSQTFDYDFSASATVTALAAAPAACLPANLSGTIACAGCAECTGTYDGTIADACSDDEHVFTFSACDVVPGGGGTGGVGYDYDLYLFAPGGAVSLAPAAYVPNPTAGTFGQFPHPNTDLIFASSTFDAGQVCTATLPGFAISNNSCAPIDVTYFLVPYDYTFDINPDPLAGEFGFYPAATGGASGVDEQLCQPIRIDAVVFPGQPTVEIIPGPTVCDDGTAMITLNLLDGAGNICGSTTGSAPAVNTGCEVTTNSVSATFTAAEIATLFASPVACYMDASGSADVEVYPNLTVVETEGCLPLAELVAEDGTVCDSQQATAYDCNNPFPYDFTNHFGGAEPAACALPAAGTVNFEAQAPPTFDCPAGATVECPVFIVVGEVSNIVTTCGVGFSTATVGPTIIGDPSCNGTIYRYTHTVTDECGQTASCDQDFLISHPPLALTCPSDNIVFECTADVVALNVWLASATATGGCGATVSNDFDPASLVLPCPGDLTIPVMFTATDDCGTVLTCSANIVLQDTQAPTIDCPANVDIIGCSLDEAPAPDITSVISEDACTSVTITHDGDVTSGSGCLVDPFTIIRTYTATDECGNNTSCSHNIQIYDNVVPMPVCPPDVELACDELPPAQPTDFAGFLAAGGSATDNCSTMFTLTDVQEVVTNTVCPEDGPKTIVRTYFIADVCGNIASCSHTFTIAEVETPMVNCPAPLELECGNYTLADIQNWLSSATVTGGCNSTVQNDFNGTSLFDPCDPAIANPFVITVNFSSVDQCPSVGCSSTIVISDNTPPTIVCPDNITDLNCLFDVPAAPNNINDFIGSVGASVSDNCSNEFALESVTDVDNGLTICPDDGLREISRTFVIADNCGNTSECTQIISYADDNTDPTIQCPLDQTVTCKADINPPAPETLVVTTSCGLGSTVTLAEPANIDDLDCDGGTFVYTYTVTDDCGRTASCDVTYTIDNPGLQLVCGDDLAVFCGTDDFQTTLDDWLANTANAINACDIPAATTNTFDPTLLEGCGGTGSQEVTFTVSDDCGFTQSCVRTITITDFFGPELTLTNGEAICDNTDGGVSNEQALQDWFNSFAGAVAEDACCEDAPILSVSPSSVSLADLSSGCDGSLTIEVTAEDCCGNTTTETATFTLTDPTDPVITSPAVDVNFNCEDGNAFENFADWIANNGGASAEDNCGVTWTTDPENPMLPACANDGPTVITFIAMDDCGNMATTTAAYMVMDNDPPVFGDNPTTIDLDGCDEFIIPEPDVSDHCSAVDLTFTDVVTEGCCDTKSVVRTWTATDACGQSSTFTQTITSTDTTPPALSFNDPVNEPLLFGLQDMGEINMPCDNIEVFTPESIDVDDCCADVTIQMIDPVYQEGNCAEDGFIQKLRCIWVATDECGNESSMTIFINIIDEVAPTFTSQPEDVTIPCSESFDMTPPTAIDNCDGELVITFEDVMSPGCQGGNLVTERTWTVTDQCGNTDQVSQTITLIDNENPFFTFVPEDLSINCDESPEFGTPEASDECTDVTISMTETSNIDGCNNTITRTWLVVDGCGNSATASQTITQTDDTAPVITPGQDATVICSADGNDTQLNAWLDTNGGASAVDDCNNVTWTNDFDAANFVDTDCAETGAFQSVTVTFTATDACGNASTTSGTFSITDNNNPTFTFVPENMSVPCGSEIVFGTPEASDECTAITITSSEMTNVFGCETVNQITWTATDACGNTTTASQTITEIDEEAPVAPSVDNVTVECPEDIPAPMELTAVDACQGDITVSPTGEMTPGNCGGSFTMVRTWTFDDGCGNTSTTTQMITVEDTTAPVAPPAPGDLTVSCSDGLPAPVELTATDNCDGNITTGPTGVMTPGDCDGEFTMVRTWTFTDACGNASSVSQTISVQDNEAPTFTGAPNVIQGVCLLDPEFITPDVSDNCSDVSVTFEDTSNGGTCGTGYDIIRTWTATDACGNTSTFEQQAWIDADTEGPTFGPLDSDIVATCNEPINFDTPTVTDNCSGCTDITLTFNDVENGGTCETGFDVTRTWTATDCCGNTSTISQTSWVYPTANSMAFTFIPADKTIGCTDEMLFGTPIGLSTCGDFEMTFADVTVEGDCGNYDVTRTWTAIDECEGIATCEQKISVVDNDPPEFTFVPEDGQVNCESEFAFGNPTCIDECNHVADVTWEDNIIQECGNSYSITRTWTATDACGNTNTASQKIDVIDDQGPIFEVELLDKTVGCDQSMSFDTPTASDQCGASFNLTFEDESTTGSCEVAFATTRTWTATDACGNTSTLAQTITRQVDSQAPVFTNTPSDYVIDCNTTPTFGNPLANDNCSDVEVTFEDTTSAGDCSTGYTTTRTWTATDACGNTGTVSQTITISQDNTLAFTNVPADQLINCGDAMNWVSPEISTNCSDEAVLSFTDETVEGNCDASYSVVRTWTAEACGILVSASATITVEDNNLPTFDLIPDNKVIACGETAAFDTPSYSDNCSNVELAFTDATSTVNCETTTTRTWTITDECGNTASAAQSITTVDNDAPVFTSTPQSIVIDCNTTPTFGTPVVEDNCGQVNLTFTDETSPGDCSTGYAVTRTWTATDECGNDVSTSQTITITEDNTLSFSNVPADQLINCGDAMNWASPEVATNCGDEAVLTFTDETVEGTCAANYAIIRTWTAEACGISVSASATITVEDNNLPTFDMIPDNKEIACGETAAFDTPLYSDNCSNVELTFTDATATVNCAVTTTRTWTITDACGNTAAAAQSITTIDTNAPVFISTPQNHIINCNTTPTFGTPVAEDNCGQVNLTFTDETSPGDCSTGYTVTRTWTATDECGNEVSTSQTITVIDETETTVTFANVPADQLINCGEELFWATPVVATNCADEAVVSFTDQTVDGDCATSYAVIRTWTAEACGISTTASATITIEDNTIPTFDVELTDKFVACGEVMEFDTPLYSDNCSEVTISHTDATSNESCENGFAITRTWTIVDACGNVANAAQTVTREADADAPTFAQIPQGGNVSCDGNFEFGEPVVIDNCSEVNVSFNDEVQQGSCEIGFTFTRTWTATDACGNVATAAQSFTVESDNTAPTFDFIPADEELVCVTNPIFGAANATDACSNVTITFEDTVNNADCSVNQVYTRTWTAIDDCGNVAQATQILTVLPDTDAPVFTFVPQDEVVDCDVILEDNFGTPEAADNCGNGFDITYTDVVTTLDCGQQITRTWSAADACGNVATASKSITIEDSAQPEIVFAPENKVLSCGTELPLETASFADNCDADFVVTFEETTEQLACGFNVHRVWTAVDNCDNVTQVNQTIEVIDNEAPIFDLVPTDQEMTFEAYANWTAPTLSAQDDCSNSNVSQPVVSRNDDCDDLQYFVTWTATDDCGNTAQHTMTIPITDEVMEVSLDAPLSVIEGNEDVLLANVDFGLAPYTYDWTILEGQGWTLDANGNIANINAGNQDATIEVKVTDFNNCSTTTIIDVASNQTTITTEFFEILPNPTYGDLNINYTSELEVNSKVTIYDVLGRKLNTWKFDAVEGINNHNLNVNPLADATYIITVEVGERYYQQKFVKLGN